MSVDLIGSLAKPLSGTSQHLSLPGPVTQLGALASLHRVECAPMLVMSLPDFVRWYDLHAATATERHEALQTEVLLD